MASPSPRVKCPMQMERHTKARGQTANATVKVPRSRRLLRIVEIGRMGLNTDSELKHSLQKVPIANIVASISSASEKAKVTIGGRTALFMRVNGKTT